MSYANAVELAHAKADYGKDGKVDMCTAIRELMADSREEGFDEKGIRVFINAINRGMSEEDAKALAEIDERLVEAARERMKK